MKIGIVCYPTYGGSGALATELGIALAHKGHSIHFISSDQPFRLDTFHDNIFLHEVETPEYPLFDSNMYPLALAGTILETIQYEELDIIHVHYAIPHAISGILAKDILGTENRVKLVTTLHGTDITLVGMEPMYFPLVKYSLERSDAVTAVSGFLAEKTRQNFSPRTPINVIHNFVNTSLYSPSGCPQLRRQVAPDNEYILMHISNFRQVKRVQDCVRILSIVRESIPAKLVLVGDGPDRHEAERLCRELDVAPHVKFLGKQTALNEILCAANVFLLPSQSESFGLSALEAMSCGVPVIASNVGGIPEVVKHGETGFLAEFGDTARMAKYVVDLLSNSRQYEKFCSNSRARAVGNFDVSLIVPQYEALYHSLLNMPT